MASPDDSPTSPPARPLDAGAGDDADLLARVGCGDREAFDELYRRYRRPLAAYLARLTGEPDAADELADDTLLVVWRRADRFAGRSRPSTWIFGIAYHKALKALERRGRRERVFPPLDDDRRHEGRPPARREPRAPNREAPDRAAARRELAGRMAEALAHLPAEQRAAVVLTYHHGLSYPEIAEVLDCPLGTVKTRMFHARRKLAKLLPELGGTPDGAPAGASEPEERR